MSSLLIKNAHIVDPVSKRDEKTDFFVEDGVIKKIGECKNVKADQVIDASGMHLFPGLVDLRTHFREPGFESKETIASGAQAALKGGYVACVSMPKTNPPCDQESVVDHILRKAKEVPFTILPAGCISKKSEGEELSQMAELRQSGVVAVTDDNVWIHNALLMRRAMEYSTMLDLVVMSHCEESSLSGKGVVNEGVQSTQLGLHGMTHAAEEVAVARDIELSHVTGAKLHVCHVSTARSVELIRLAKAKGLKVTAEVTPHHLALTEQSLEGYNTNFKMLPPLRTETDRQALIEGLKDGTIDCVATDHSPHTQEEKMRQFDHAPFGTIGLETSFAVVLTELFHKYKWSLSEIIYRMSTRPAEIIQGPSFLGRLREGDEANFTIVDVNREWVVSHKEFRSKSKNSCFMNAKLKGRVMMTMCRNQLWRFDDES